VRARILLVLVPLAAALVVAPAGDAKVKLWLSVSDRTPRAGETVTAVLRSEVKLDWNLKLIAVAPGKSWYDVVGVVTGDSVKARARIPHDGFAVRVVRAAPNRWRAHVRFPRAGRWRLLIPNEAPDGFMIPPPVVREVVVH
jgi:hypothetical protein